MNKPELSKRSREESSSGSCSSPRSGKSAAGATRRQRRAGRRRYIIAHLTGWQRWAGRRLHAAAAGQPEPPLPVRISRQQG